MSHFAPPYPRPQGRGILRGGVNLFNSVQMNKEIKTLLKKIVTYTKKKNLHLYLVGGFLRDYFLKIPNNDIDFVTSADAEKFGQLLAKKIKASFVRLDEKNKIYRVVWLASSAGRRGPPASPVGGGKNKKVYNLDFSQMQGQDIKEDLGRRDFTINALALPIVNLSTYLPRRQAGQLINLRNIIDPYNGVKDLKSGIIRKINDKTFDVDSLRLIRAFRFRAQLGFKIESKTLQLLRNRAKLINLSAPERIREELCRIFATRNSPKILKQMDQVNLLKYIFPEIVSMKKSARKFYFHPQGLWQHSVESLEMYEKMLNNPKKYFYQFSKKICPHLAEKVNGIDRQTLLKFIVLFHDVAKPQTAQREGEKMRFIGHEKKGASIIKGIFKRLKFGKAEINIAEKVIHYHMRPGNLTQLPQITNRAIYRYFRDLGKEGIDLLILSLADRYSYLRISKKPEEIVRHHKKILKIFRRYYEEKEKVTPPKLINGYEVMKICQIPPGPRVGELLRLIEEAQAEGKIKTKEEAKKFLLSLITQIKT